MRRLGLLLIMLLGSALVAQSDTLPKGWDTTDGTDSPGTTNSFFWTGFRITSDYMPAKALYSYDASLFPWDAGTASKTITKISFRSDGPENPGTSTAHTKKMVLIMSTSTHHPAQANFNFFDGNHGPNRTVVFGAIGTPKDVDFPATTKPTSGPAPFNVTITLDKAFLVPQNATTLVIEVRAYSSSVTTGWFDGDTVRYPGTNYNGGAFALINTDHCVSPSIFFTSRAFTTGSNFGQVWRPSQSPGDKLVYTILGDKLTTPILFPGSTSCMLQLDPNSLWAMRTDISEKSGAYSVFVDWGTVPMNASWVGLELNHQSLFVDSAYPGSVGLTRAATSTLGSGYDPALCHASAIYSHGPSTSRYTASVDPDKERYSRFLYRRVPVIKIN